MKIFILVLVQAMRQLLRCKPCGCMHSFTLPSMINMGLDLIFDVIHLTQASLAKLKQSVSVNPDSDSTTIASTSVNHDAHIADLSDLETGMSLSY